MDEKKYLSRILDYEADRLGKGERFQFEQDIAQQPLFKAFYTDWQASKNVQDVLVYENLRSQLKEIAIKKTIVKTAWPRYLSIAAGFLLLFISGLTIYANNHYADSALAQSFYETPNFSLNRSESILTKFEQAKLAFTHKEYKKCIVLLSTTNNTQEDFLLAHAFYHNKNFNKAKVLFSNISQLPDIRTNQQAEWFTVLAALQGNNQEDVIIILNKIAKDKNHPYVKEANKLRKQLVHSLRKLVW